MKAPFLINIDSSDIIATYKNPLISDTYMHPSKSNLKIDNPSHKILRINYLSDRTVDIVTSKGAFEKSNSVSNLKDSLVQKNNADFVSESNINCSVPDIDKTNLDNSFNSTLLSEKKEFTVKDSNDYTSQKIITKKTPRPSLKKTLLLKIKSSTKKNCTFSIPTDTFLQKLCNKSRNSRIFIVKGNSINPLLCEIKRVDVTLKADYNSSECSKTRMPPPTTDYLERVMKRIPVSTNSSFYILSKEENSLLPLILKVESNSYFRFDILHVFYMKNINDEFDSYFTEFGVISEFHKIYTVFFEDEIMLSRFRHIESIQNNTLSELRCIDKCIMNFNNYFVNYKNMYLFLNKGIFARFEYNALDKTLPSASKILTDLISTIFADPYFEIFLILFPELSYVKKFLEYQGYTRLPLSKTYLAFTIFRFKFELLKSKIKNELCIRKDQFKFKQLLNTNIFVKAILGVRMAFLLMISTYRGLHVHILKRFYLLTFISFLKFYYPQMYNFYSLDKIWFEEFLFFDDSFDRIDIRNYDVYKDTKEITQDSTFFLTKELGIYLLRLKDSCTAINLSVFFSKNKNYFSDNFISPIFQIIVKTENDKMYLQEKLYKYIDNYLYSKVMNFLHDQ